MEVDDILQCSRTEENLVFMLHGLVAHERRVPFNAQFCLPVVLLSINCSTGTAYFPNTRIHFSCGFFFSIPGKHGAVGVCMLATDSNTTQIFSGL